MRLDVQQDIIYACASKNWLANVKEANQLSRPDKDLIARASTKQFPCVGLYSELSGSHCLCIILSMLLVNMFLIGRTLDLKSLRQSKLGFISIISLSLPQPLFVVQIQLVVAVAIEQKRNKTYYKKFRSISMKLKGDPKSFIVPQIKFSNVTNSLTLLPLLSLVLVFTMFI